MQLQNQRSIIVFTGGEKRRGRAKVQFSLGRRFAFSLLVRFRRREARSKRIIDVEPEERRLVYLLSFFLFLSFSVSHRMFPVTRRNFLFSICSDLPSSSKLFFVFCFYGCTYPKQIVTRFVASRRSNPPTKRVRSTFFT